MTVASGDVLRPAQWSKALHHYWRGLDLLAVAGRVADAAQLTGVVLPYTRVDGRPVFPLAVIDEKAVEQRLRRDQGPILDRGRLQDFATAGFASAPPEAVVLAGFVVMEPFSVARRHLAGLRTWAPTVAAVPAWRVLGGLDAAEADYHGYRVYLADDGNAVPVDFAARLGRRPERPDPWRRLRDEQMFQLALTSGLVPS